MMMMMMISSKPCPSLLVLEQNLQIRLKKDTYSFNNDDDNPDLFKLTLISASPGTNFEITFNKKDQITNEII